MSVDVVVVNWNSGRQLRACIESVLEFGDGLVGRIVVVDNGSTDDSLELGPAGGGVTVVRAGGNLGFAKACNAGAAGAAGDYLLFLNPDVRVLRGALAAVCRFMEGAGAAAVGICGVKLVGEDGKVQRGCARFPGWLHMLSIASGANALLPSLFPGHLMADFDHERSRAVDHVIGAFYFVRRGLFEELGGFDERFFVYLEDLDFSLRARKSGRAAYYLAEAEAFHKGGGTSEQVKAHRLFYSLRSRLLYAFKHFGRGQAWCVSAVTLLLEPFPRLLRAAARRSGAEALDTLRGYAMLWGDLPGLVRRALHD
ncbi:MAG: glycosyltransferase family 2 protein [Thermodesulfobacteriota bacterium]